jgi:hypothetical protein
MINIEDVLRDVPHFDKFCSVAQLHALAERLRKDENFEVQVAGVSANGLPIHHIRCGKGAVKALFFGGPHCMEPIGGLTVASLLAVLEKGNRSLLDADVEWHFVPCIDPDGALLNEGWTQQSFSLENFMRYYFQQTLSEQVDGSFPVNYKKMIWSRPSQEATVARDLIDKIRPDFFFSLHNARTGGAFYFLTRDIGPKGHKQIYDLLQRHDFPLQKRPIWRELYTPFAEGILPMHSTKNYYDFLARTSASPEKVVTWGGSSFDYLAEIKPDAQVFVAEMGYARHPDDQSDELTGQNLRHFKLRIEADSKYLGTALLEEWEKVKGDVDSTSPFFRAIAGGAVFPSREKLAQAGVPLSRYSSQDTLFNPLHDRGMTVGDRFDACLVDGGFMFLQMSYQFVRLLKASPQTPAVRSAIARLEPIFDGALKEIARHVDFAAFKVFDYDTLAKVQLGSGLIVINSLLEANDR